MRAARFLIVTLLVLIVPHVLHAQSITDLQSGVRVRVDVRNSGVMIGKLSSATTDSIRVVGDGETRAFSLSDVTSVSTSPGPSSTRGMLRTAITAGLIGAAAGAGIGAMTFKPCEGKGIYNCAFVPNSRSRATVFGAAVFGVTSFAIGGIVGAIRGSDAWTPVALH